MNRSDIPHLAILLVTVGQKLGQIGEQAWIASQEYAPGPRAQNTDSDSTGGNRWDTDDDGTVWPIPADPTGEAGTGHDPTSLLHARYRSLLEWLADNADDIDRLLGQLVPHPPGVTVVGCKSCGALKPGKARKIDPTDVVADGWCKSCFRLEGLLEPITTDSAGRPYYRGLCRWCGGFKAEHGIEPPVPLLQLRHRHGRRISVADAERHCQHCQAKAS